MASCASSSCSETLSKSCPCCPSVLVSNDLMQIIKDPEEERKRKGAFAPSLFAHLTTMDELLMHVKNYIVKHKLYDPKNPVKILAHENELGSLLGKSEFSLLDVRDILLQKFVFPVGCQNSCDTICSIRESDLKSVSKKQKLDNNDSGFSVKLIKSDPRFNSGENMQSFQGYETEFVKERDSSSDANFSVNGLILAETFDVECEIETEIDSDCSYESGSELEDFIKTAIIDFIAHTSDSDIEYLADGSSDDESEKELSEEDKWRCLSCGTLNDPVVRNCCACWGTTRVGWLPDRSEILNKRDARDSKRKAFPRNKRKLSKKPSKDSSNHKLAGNLSSATSESLRSPSSPCIEKSDVSFLDLHIPVATTESLNPPSISYNGNSDVNQSSSNTLEANKDSLKTELDKHLCLFCCTKPADSTIIHGRVGCRICCYQCGKKLQAENKRCPVCRRNIERIVYLYNS